MNLNILIDGYKRTRARAYASFIGVIIWLIFGCNSEFTKSDIVVLFILMGICVVFCDVQQRKYLIIKKLRENQNEIQRYQKRNDC